MFDDTQAFLSSADLDAIHETSIKLLENVGVDFPLPEAVDVFKRHDVRTEGWRVYLDQRTVEEAVRQAPPQFIIHARNSERSVVVGGEEVVFAPGYGAPFLIDLDVGQRKPTMDDYRNLVRLADALPNQDMSGYMLVKPSDVPPEKAHLHMLHANIVHSDKPFMGSDGMPGARHSVEMAGILFGDQEGLREKPALIGLVNPLSPLSFSDEMLAALMEYARWRQPLIVASMVGAGSTGPITLAGVVAQQNAEVLAGITLAQLVSPGTPVVYGSTSTNTDMKTGALPIGSPELAVLIVATAQMAHYYNLPCRSGGCLTDSHLPDAQAGYESMRSLLTTVNAGVDFVLHACGILSSFLAFSYEKMVIDDEICGIVRRFRRGLTVTSEELAYEVIAGVGPGGNYMTEEQTYRLCRTAFWLPAISTRLGLSEWLNRGSLDAAHRARQRWQKLLAEHEAPALDTTTARQLERYVEAHL